MEYWKTLIDKAADICGGQNILAERLGFSKGTLSDMKKGRKAVSPATAVQLADLAHTNVEEATHLAIIQSVAGTRREQEIRQILGKGQAVGAAAMLGISYNGDSITDTAVIKTATKRVAPKLTKIYIVSSKF